VSLKKILNVILLVGVWGIFALKFVQLENKVNYYKDRTQIKLKKYRHSLNSFPSLMLQIKKNEFSLPKELLNVPLAGKQMILDVKEVSRWILFRARSAHEAIDNRSCHRGGRDFLFVQLTRTRTRTCQIFGTNEMANVLSCP